MTDEIMKLMKDRKELKKPDQENQTEEYNEIDKKINDGCRLSNVDHGTMINAGTE